MPDTGRWPDWTSEEAKTEEEKQNEQLAVARLVLLDCPLRAPLARDRSRLCRRGGQFQMTNEMKGMRSSSRCLFVLLAEVGIRSLMNSIVLL